MLSEERYTAILDRLHQNHAVTVQELVDELDASPATIRRDLTVLHNRGLLQKVHGGAVTIDVDFHLSDTEIGVKANIFREEKQKIAMMAASLITNNDFVYIDAGTTTELLLPHLNCPEATIVTNGTAHAAYLASRQYNVILLGGTVKGATAAVVGPIATEQLQRFNFTKGFFGTNGISLQGGFTTPDPQEAAVKQMAIARCHTAYVLSDASKFDKLSPITFATLDKATIITTKLPNSVYLNQTLVQEVNP